jgi:hypothetical protein
MVPDLAENAPGTSRNFAALLRGVRARVSTHYYLTKEEFEI